MKKLVGYLRVSLFSCFSAKCPQSPSTSSRKKIVPSAIPTTAQLKNRLSSSLAEQHPFLRETHCQEAKEPTGDDESPADSTASSRQFFPPSPTRSTVVGTVYGHRRGRVCFCLQRDLSDPPPFVLELSIPTCRLAREMQMGVVRVTLECDRRDATTGGGGASSRGRSLHSAPLWKAYCNGVRVGYAVRRKPTEKDRFVLRTVRSTTAGAGVLFPSEKEGELMYMRASYERVVGSRDSESYHLINPGGSPDQELSIFLLRTG